jgi:hypothetical protein
MSLPNKSISAPCSAVALKRMIFSWVYYLFLKHYFYEEWCFFMKLLLQNWFFCEKLLYIFLPLLKENSVCISCLSHMIFSSPQSLGGSFKSQSLSLPSIQSVRMNFIPLCLDMFLNSLISLHLYRVRLEDVTVFRMLCKIRHILVPHLYIFPQNMRSFFTAIQKKLVKLLFDIGHICVVTCRVDFAARSKENLKHGSEFTCTDVGLVSYCKSA